MSQPEKGFDWPIFTLTLIVLGLAAIFFFGN